jgi:hypothetical protein
MKYNVKMPVNIQNAISSIYVTISDVLKDLRNILKKSNKMPISMPLTINNIKIYA